MKTKTKKMRGSAGLGAADDAVEEERAAGCEADGDDDNPRAGSQFAAHLKKKNEANSEFSRNKTIGQQRRSLPVFQVREELLQVRRPRQRWERKGGTRRRCARCGVRGATCLPGPCCAAELGPKAAPSSPLCLRTPAA